LAGGGPVPPAPAGLELKPVNAADLGSVWSLVREACGGNRRLSVLMNEMQLVSVGEQTAVVRVADEVRAAVASTEKDLAAAMATVLGREVRVEISGKAQHAEAGAALPGATDSPLKPEEPLTAVRTPITDHPLVKHAIELFGARVISVQPRRTRPTD